MAGTQDVAPPRSCPWIAPSAASSSTMGATICSAGLVPPSSRLFFRLAICTGTQQPRRAPRNCKQQPSTYMIPAQTRCFHEVKEPDFQATCSSCMGPENAYASVQSSTFLDSLSQTCGLSSFLKCCALNRVSELAGQIRMHAWDTENTLFR